MGTYTIGYIHATPNGHLFCDTFPVEDTGLQSVTEWITQNLGFMNERGIWITPWAVLWVRKGD